MLQELSDKQAVIDENLFAAHPWLADVKLHRLQLFPDLIDFSQKDYARYDLLVKAGYDNDWVLPPTDGDSGVPAFIVMTSHPDAVEEAHRYMNTLAETTKAARCRTCTLADFVGRQQRRDDSGNAIPFVTARINKVVVHATTTGTSGGGTLPACLFHVSLFPSADMIVTSFLRNLLNDSWACCADLAAAGGEAAEAAHGGAGHV